MIGSRRDARTSLHLPVRCLGHGWVLRFGAPGVLALALALPPGNGAHAQSGEPWALPGSTVHSQYRAAASEAGEMIREMMELRGIPGLSVAVGVEGEIAWSRGFGMANVELGVPVTPLTRFRSGSTAKPMTAALLGHLVERGELDLDAPVQTYVPDYPRQPWDITARQLAGHLSGIRHYPPDGDEFLSTRRYTNVTDGLEIFKDDPLLFQPGTQYSYSSYAWNLLSAVIEGATGEVFLDLMHREVFEPIGMRSTLGDHSDSIVVNRVSFYERTGGTPSYRTRQTGWGDGTGIGSLFNAPYTDNSNKWAGGGFLTTPEDLVRFGMAHRPGAGYLPDPLLAEMHTPMRLADGSETGYGIGWNVGRDNTTGSRTVGHGGGSVGGTTALVTYPEEGVVVAIQANLTNASYGDLAARIARLFIQAGRQADR